MCPLGSAVAGVFTASEPHTGGQLTIAWVPESLPSSVPVTVSVGLRVYIQGGSLVYSSTSAHSPVHISTGAHNYNIWVTTSASCLSGGTNLVATVWGGCASTALAGYVWTAGTTTPVYDAEVQVAGSGLSNTAFGTGTGGYYYDSSGSSCGTSRTVSQLWIDSLGYLRSISGPITLPAWTTTWINVSLYPAPATEPYLFAQPGGPQETYDLDHYANQNVSPSYSVFSSENIQNAALQWVSDCNSPPCLSAPPAPPSPDPGGHVLEMTATDTSTSAAGNHFSQLVLSLGTAPSPFTGSYGTNAAPGFSVPTDFEFNVYVPNSSYDAHFSVDAFLSDNITLSQFGQIPGDSLLDMKSLPCTAASLNYTRAHWVQEVCDATGLLGVNITQFLLVYNNAGIPGTGSVQIAAYFDSIRLVNPLDPTTMANGGFELQTQADGWLGGTQISVLTSPPRPIPRPYDGIRDALMGQPPAAICNLVTCPTGGTGQKISQLFRVPDQFSTPLSMFLDGWYNFNGTCPTISECYTSSSFFQVYLTDLTLQGAGINVFSMNASTALAGRGGWNGFAFNLTPYEGHLMFLTIEVNNGVYYSQESHQWTADDTWVYLDDIVFNGQWWGAGFSGISAPSAGSNIYTATLNMTQGRAWFLQSWNNAVSWNYAFALNSVNTTRVTNASYKVNSTGQWYNNPVIDQATTGLDIVQFGQTDAQSADVLFNVHADANGTGFVKGGHGSYCYYLDVCAVYNYVHYIALTVNLSWVPGSGTDALNGSTSLQRPQSMGNVISNNLTSSWGVAPSGWAGDYSQQQTSAGDAFWIAVGIVAGIAVSVLTGGLPEVFGFAIGAAVSLAEGWLQNAFDDQTLSSYGSNCTQAAPWWLNSVDMSLAITCLGITTGGINTFATTASINFSLMGTIGEPNLVGAKYVLTVTNTTYFCDYNGAPPAPPLGCTTLSQPLVSEDMMTFIT